MRIGIDASILISSLRAGIYVYVRRMLDGLYRIGQREPVTLFLPNYPKTVDSHRHRELQDEFPAWPVKDWGIPGWAYNLRLRFSAYSRMQVFHYPSTPLFFPIISERTNVFTIPDLTFIHYPHHHRDWNVESWTQFCKQAVEHGDMILTYSEHTKQDICRTLGVPERKILATPLAAGTQFQPIADRSLLRQQLAAFGLQDQRYILSVGTLEPRKNQVRLIRAFARLMQREPRIPHRLVFASGKGWNHQPIFDAVTQEGLEDRVQFLGQSDPLEVLYNGADVMVYPSLYEGFGLPPLEAMACGTPVITSNRSSLPEVVGNAAVSVDPEDEDALCESMRQVLGDDKLREQLGTNGIQRAKQFSWERTASATLQAYRAAYRMKS